MIFLSIPFFTDSGLWTLILMFSVFFLVIGITLPRIDMADSNDNIQRPYKCTVHIALPSNQYAQHLKDVISVDQEISNKVVKSFAIVSASDIDGRHSNDRDDIVSGRCNGSDDMNVLQM